MSDDDGRAVHEHFVRGLGASTRQNALAYGYSLALTGTFGILAITDRSPHVVDVFLFGIGAALTFTIANTALTRGFTVRVEDEPPIVLALGTSFGFLSISGALGAATLIGWGLAGWPGWFLGGFAASAVYLLLSGLELVVGRGLRALFGREHLARR
jgi:hypothetical protein